MLGKMSQYDPQWGLVYPITGGMSFTVSNERDETTVLCYDEQIMKAQLHLASLTRGLYRRVADELDLDPSYVSRVARGERQSPAIQARLRREISKIVVLALKPRTKNMKNRSKS